MALPNDDANLEIWHDIGARQELLCRWSLTNWVHHRIICLHVVCFVRQTRAFLITLAICASSQEKDSLHWKTSRWLHLHSFAIQRLGNVGVAISN
jgi:hypothetical protein